MSPEKRNTIIEKLRSDENYYGDFGRQFLSNSNISTLLEDPKSFGESTPNNPNFVVGGYFHTKVLEPEKLEKFKVIDASTRNTNKYKEEANGEVCILKKEVENVDLMVDALMSNERCKDLVAPLLGGFEYELPGIVELYGNLWKGKADIINHDEGLVIDLKTTSSLDTFDRSASKYNYDSQAFIYKAIFGYDLMFIAIDKKSHRIGIFDCSETFYGNGEEKVKRATAVYNQFFKEKTVDISQHIITQTL